jgi:EmrB/QacA subfamily drug resistance transporter
MTQISLQSPHRAHRSGAALALLLTASFMVVLDFSIVNVALAAIERDLHADATAVQWVITAYAITFGGLLVLGGRMGDLWGLRRMFVIGLVIFSLASLAGGLAGNLSMLIAARAVQGVGAAIVAPAALSLITTTVAEGPARTRALSYYGASSALGFVAGLVLGGVLVEFLDWRAVLWVNVPVGLVAALLTPALVPAPGRRADRQRLDVTGAVLVTGSVASVVYGISEGPVHGWLSWSTGEAVVVAIVLIWAFILVEQRRSSPLIRLGILQLRSLRSANLYMAMIGAWLAGELLVLPLYLQQVAHYSPLLTGLAIAPQGVIAVLGATQGARVAHRLGLRVYLTVSGISAGVGLALLGLALGHHRYPLMLVGLLLTGYGTATGVFAATLAATEDVDDAEQGLAGGLINMSRQVGAAVGVAVSAAVIGSRAAAANSVTAGRVAIFVSAVAGVLAAVIALRGIGTRSIRAATAPDDRVHDHPSHRASISICEVQQRRKESK